MSSSPIMMPISSGGIMSSVPRAVVIGLVEANGWLKPGALLRSSSLKWIALLKFMQPLRSYPITRTISSSSVFSCLVAPSFGVLFSVISGPVSS